MVARTIPPRTLADANATPTDADLMHKPIGMQGRLSEAQELALAKEKHIDVNVPKAYRLTDDYGVVHQIAEGVQSMPASWVDHWYSKAHGVTRVSDVKRSEDA